MKTRYKIPIVIFFFTTLSITIPQAFACSVDSFYLLWSPIEYKVSSDCSIIGYGGNIPLGTIFILIVIILSVIVIWKKRK